MATYVLVHGAWHGGWCWQLVTPILRAASHEVYTPTLTGMGDRAHLLSCGADLATHVRDVTNLIDYEDLTDIILVGHGAAALVLGQVIDEMESRIGQLAYLDAYLPTSLQGGVLPHTEDAADAVIPPPPAAALGIHEARMARWVEQRLRPQPIATQRLADLPARNVLPFPCSYVHFTNGAMSALTAPFARRARADGWSMYDLDAGHDAMLTHPRPVADLLLGLSVVPE